MQGPYKYDSINTGVLEKPSIKISFLFLNQ